MADLVVERTFVVDLFKCFNKPFPVNDTITGEPVAFVDAVVIGNVCGEKAFPEFAGDFGDKRILVHDVVHIKADTEDLFVHRT